MPSVNVVLDCRHSLGESIVWDDMSGELVWVNIHDREIWRYALSGKATRTTLPDRVGAIGLREGGGLIVAMAKGFACLGPAAKNPEMIAAVEAELPTTRLNDGKCDRAGNFVCGGMNEADRAAISALYRIDPAGNITRLLDGITCANSIAFSPAGTTMYFTDMPTARIRAYAYDTDIVPLGAEKNGWCLPEGAGLPDGSTVDEEGFLWNAEWGGGKIVRYSPEGHVDMIVTLPVSNPTCVGFGGPAYDTLYVTSARFGLADEQLLREPLAGSVFSIKTGTRGMPEPRFRG